MRETQFIYFTVSDKLFAIEIENIQEIIRYRKPLKVPKSPDFLEGVIDLRGTVVPIFDLGKKFDLYSGDKTGKEKVIILRTGMNVVGVIVDSVKGVLSVEEKDIDLSHHELSPRQANVIKGYIRKDDSLIMVLDMDRVISADEKIALKDFRTSMEISYNSR